METKESNTTLKVGTNIRILRTKQNISQEKLAELSYVSRATLGSIELGKKSPTVETLAKISNALNIELYKLFLFED